MHIDIGNNNIKRDFDNIASDSEFHNLYRSFQEQHKFDTHLNITKRRRNSESVHNRRLPWREGKNSRAKPALRRYISVQRPLSRFSDFPPASLMNLDEVPANGAHVEAIHNLRLQDMLPGQQNAVMPSRPHTERHKHISKEKIACKEEGWHSLHRVRHSVIPTVNVNCSTSNDDNLARLGFVKAGLDGDFSVEQKTRPLPPPVEEPAKDAADEFKEKNELVKSAKQLPRLAQTKVQLGMCIKKWMIINRIGAGSFGETFTAIDVESLLPYNNSHDEFLSPTPEAVALLNSLPPLEARKEVCIKVEQEGKNVLRLESLALKRVQLCSQVVRYITSGCASGINYLVMEKLGPNLAELRRRSPHGTFNIFTTLKVGISCLSAIRSVHEQGLVHRDIKPSNFVTGLPGTVHQATCFIIDFGLARRYRRSSGDMRPPRENAGFRGTSRYASVASHHHTELGRVDDIWSLLFMLVEFVTGMLPWRKYKDKEDIGRCKEESISPHLVRNLPREFQHFLAHLQTLRYEDEPDYDLLLALMQHALERRGYPEGKLVDWEMDSSVMEKVAEAEIGIIPQKGDVQNHSHDNNSSHKSHAAPAVIQGIEEYSVNDLRLLQRHAPQGLGFENRNTSATPLMREGAVTESKILTTRRSSLLTDAPLLFSPQNPAVEVGHVTLTKNIPASKTRLLGQPGGQLNEETRSRTGVANSAHATMLRVIPESNSLLCIGRQDDVPITFDDVRAEKGKGYMDSSETPAVQDTHSLPKSMDVCVEQDEEFTSCKKDSAMVQQHLHGQKGEEFVYDKKHVNPSPLASFMLATLPKAVELDSVITTKPVTMATSKTRGSELQKSVLASPHRKHQRFKTMMQCKCDVM